MTNPCIVQYLILAMCKFQHEWLGDHFNMLGPLCQVEIKVPPCMKFTLGKSNIYNVNKVCFIILVQYQIWFEQKTKNPPHQYILFWGENTL
jgi:hypothetical protein